MYALGEYLSVSELFGNRPFSPVASLVARSMEVGLFLRLLVIRICHLAGQELQSLAEPLSLDPCHCFAKLRNSQTSISSYTPFKSSL